MAHVTAIYREEVQATASGLHINYSDGQVRNAKTEPCPQIHSEGYGLAFCAMLGC